MKNILLEALLKAKINLNISNSFNKKSEYHIHLPTKTPNKLIKFKNKE